jgi:hypothetical protein
MGPGGGCGINFLPGPLLLLPYTSTNLSLRFENQRATNYMARKSAMTISHDSCLSRRCPFQKENDTETIFVAIPKPSDIEHMRAQKT